MRLFVSVFLFLLLSLVVLLPCSQAAEQPTLELVRVSEAAAGRRQAQAPAESYVHRQGGVTINRDLFTLQPRKFVQQRQCRGSGPQIGLFDDTSVEVVHLKKPRQEPGAGPLNLARSAYRGGPSRPGSRHGPGSGFQGYSSFFLGGIPSIGQQF